MQTSCLELPYLAHNLIFIRNDNTGPPATESVGYIFNCTLHKNLNECQMLYRLSK